MSWKDYGPPPWAYTPPPWMLYQQPYPQAPVQDRPKKLKDMIKEANDFKEWLESLKKKDEKPKEKTYTFTEMFVMTLALSQIIAPASWMLTNYLWHAAGIK